MEQRSLPPRVTALPGIADLLIGAVGLCSTRDHQSPPAARAGPDWRVAFCPPTYLFRPRFATTTKSRARTGSGLMQSVLATSVNFFQRFDQNRCPERKTSIEGRLTALSSDFYSTMLPSRIRCNSHKQTTGARVTRQFFGGVLHSSLPKV